MCRGANHCLDPLPMGFISNSTENYEDRAFSSLHGLAPSSEAIKHGRLDGCSKMTR